MSVIDCSGRGESDINDECLAWAGNYLYIF